MNSPEDIDASVILEEKKKYDEVRRKRQEDQELFRNLKMLPLEQRSMTKEQIKQLIYVRRPNETVFFNLERRHYEISFLLSIKNYVCKFPI